MFIVAALVGAVGVGGALAYTYKSFVAPNGGRVPLVKADPNVKVRPETVALLANDKRMQGRLGEDAGQQNTPPHRNAGDRAGSDESGGPRRVRTIPITPGGGPPPGIQMTPPAQAAAPPSIPGIMLENMAPRGPAATAAGCASAAAAAGDDRPAASTNRRRKRSRSRRPQGGRPRRLPQVAKAPPPRKQRAPPPPADCQHWSRIRCGAVVAENAHGCPQGLRRSAAEVW